MSNGDHTDWASAAWEVVKFILAGLGTVASSIALWFGARLSGHIAMLRRHDKWIETAEPDLGELKAFRIVAGEGPVGEKLKVELQKIHRRINRRRRAQERTDKRVIEMRTDIKHILEAVERLEKKQ